MKFDHIGIFVKELDHGYCQFSKIINITNKSQVYNDDQLQVSVQFLYDEVGICYELVAPNGPKNPVDIVFKNGERFLNHIAYTSNNFEKQILKLREVGCIPLDVPKPAIAFKGARVIFFLTPLKFIFELVEDING